MSWRVVRRKDRRTSWESILLMHMKVNVLYSDLQVMQTLIKAYLVPSNAHELLQSLIEVELNVIHIGHQFVLIFITMLP